MEKGALASHDRGDSILPFPGAISEDMMVVTEDDDELGSETARIDTHLRTLYPIMRKIFNLTAIWHLTSRQDRILCPSASTEKVCSQQIPRKALHEPPAEADEVQYAYVWSYY